MKEIWKLYRENNLKKTDSRYRKYEVSNYGRVKLNGKILEPRSIEPNDYVYYSCGRIHRIVAKLFVENPDNKPCVDHIDGDKHNNRADNLRWVTYKENCANPITKQKWLSTIKGEEYRKKKSDKYKDEEFLELFSKRISDSMTEEVKSRISVTLKNRYQDLELRNLVSEQTKAALNKPETRKRLSENAKSRCWVHNDTNERFILKTELEEYLSNGWEMRRHPNSGNKISQTKRKLTQ